MHTSLHLYISITTMNFVSVFLSNRFSIWYNLRKSASLQEVVSALDRIDEIYCFADFLWVYLSWPYIKSTLIVRSDINTNAPFSFELTKKWTLTTRILNTHQPTINQIYAINISYIIYLLNSLRLDLNIKSQPDKPIIFAVFGVVGLILLGIKIHSR